MARTAELIRGIRAARSESRAKLRSVMEDHEGKVIEEFWLVNAFAAEMPLGGVKGLLERDDVLYIEPEQTEDVPPQNANNNDDVDDARGRMNTDPYFNLGQTGGYIGLLDSGMRFTHSLFASPSNLDFRRDCVNGGSDCNSGSSLNFNDDCWNHGTSSGGIITANGNQGAAFRGVTGVTLDSFKVYPTSFDVNNAACTGGLSTTAAVRGFQSAIAVLDRVIVAEMQSSSTTWVASRSRPTTPMTRGRSSSRQTETTGPAREP